MTLLVATIGPSFAILTQDTAWGTAEKAAPELLARSAVTAAEFGSESYPGPPGGEVAPTTFHAAKIWVRPGLKAAVGGAGCMAAHLGFAHGLAESGVASIEAIAEEAPRLLARAGSGRFGPYMAVAVGWSEAEGRALGFAFASGEDFTPRRMEQGSGHALHPAPATEDPDYVWVERMWRDAALGHGTLHFHRAYAANVARAAAAGRYPRGIVLGGLCQSVTVTPEGIRDAWAALPGQVPTELQTPFGPRKVRLGRDGRLEFPDGALVAIDMEARHWGETAERGPLEWAKASLDAA